MQPLSGLDAGFLYLEAAGTPMHVGCLMRLQPPRRRAYDFHHALLDLLAQRLPDTPVLRRILESVPFGLGHPVWREIDAPDLRHHVRRRRLRSPGGERQLMALVARLHADPLPRTRPLWRFVVIEGLAEGQLGLYCQIHHAVLDGQGGVALARALLDAAPSRAGHAAAERSVPRRAQGRRPTQGARVARAALAADAQRLLRLLRALPPTLRVIAAAGRGGSLRERLQRWRERVKLAPRTRFNAQVSAARSLAATTLPLERVRSLARRAGASLNDAVMAICTGALREELMHLGELPPEPLIAAMPVSLRVAGDAGIDNRGSMVQCPLPTTVAAPLTRLQQIVTGTSALKRSVARWRGIIPTDFPGFGAPLWAEGLSRLWSDARLSERLPALANLVISNVPGPSQILHLAGARILHYTPLSIVTHGLALNLTVQSYAGQLEVGITACRAALPEPGRLARRLHDALEELERAVPA